MGNKDEDWTVDYEATGERCKRSLEHWKGGDRKSLWAGESFGIGMETETTNMSTLWRTLCLSNLRRIWMSR